MRTTRRLGGTRPLAVLTAVVVTLALAMSARYAWTSGAQQAPSPPEPHIVVAATEYIGTCPLLAAAANGYFTADGVLVTIQFQPSGKAALDAALRGEADVVTVADVPIAFAALARQPVSVIATIAAATDDHAILARTDRALVSPGSLRSRRLGVPFGTSAHFFLDALLNRMQLSADDVTLVNLAPEALAPALSSGVVDGIALWQPQLRVAATSLGAQASVVPGDDVYEVAYNLATTRGYAVTHRESLERFLRGVVRGARFCRESPASARGMVARALHIEARLVEELWGSYRFDVGLHQALLLALEDEARWAIENHLVETREAPDFLDYVTLDSLEAVAPGTVTLIH